MWTKSINIEVIVICFLSIIPWPGPSVFKISCSRENSRVVRKIVQSKWLPILEKYQVKLPLECPFHPMRDIFGPQQAAKKQNRPSQWTCGLCGKSFFEEKHLDMHFENRHKSNINMAEDAICLADYCDMMRCEVLVAKDSSLALGGDPNMMSTDIEVWSESTAYRTALTTSSPRDLAKVPIKKSLLPKILQTIKSEIISKGKRVPITSTANSKAHHCDKKDKHHAHKRHNRAELSSKSDDSEVVEDDHDDDEDDDDDENDADKNETECDNLVDSALPPVDGKQQKISEMQRMKANCKTEELDQLKTRCEFLVRDCIAGLLVHLSLEDFKNMEEEMNRAVCWYLTCERYWEDGPLDQRPFPWGLVFVLVMVLSLGVCMCYYIIWVLFDTDDYSPSGSNQITAHSSPTHSRLYLQPQSSVSTSGIYHLRQDGAHSSTGHINTNLSTSNMTTEQHTPQIHAQPHSQVVQHHQQPPYGDDFYTSGGEFSEVGQSEHYIYVTYPPELKRRLLESCYNRTTRL